MNDNAFLRYGGPLLVSAAVLGASILGAARVLRGPEGSDTASRDPNPLTLGSIEEQFKQEVSRQAKTFKLISVRNVRVTRDGGVIVLDFDYQPTEPPGAAKTGATPAKPDVQAVHNFEMEDDGEGRFIGTVRAAQDRFDVRIY
ncbi:MAG TPA: hypothetical protein VI643_05495 [Planctomycetota bacterium]|nr:hypothetical protein [Planctomycetota bacterium]